MVGFMGFHFPGRIPTAIYRTIGERFALSLIRSEVLSVDRLQREGLC